MDIIHAGFHSKNGVACGIGGELANNLSLGGPNLELSAHQGSIVHGRQLGNHDARQGDVLDLELRGVVVQDLNMVMGIVQNVPLGGLGFLDDVVASRQGFR